MAYEEVEYRNQFVIFGEGSTVQYIKKRTEVDFEGRVVWIFLLRPSKEVIDLYRLNTMTDLDPNSGLIVRRYPRSVIHILDDNPNHTRILVHTDLNNRPTPYSRIFEKYEIQIDRLEQTNSTLKTAIAGTLQELKLSASSRQEHLKLMVEEINIAREASKQLTHDEDDTSAEDED